ncbi:ABC transporter substrate-binding protein [Streptomyces sp. PSKA28]|uniref:ABC transporter substrate-binding protein n=1 Tax=Streptomyces himalayensis subsp. himalayensis TaxID=2756131 RepID=A0A7W0ICZ1_9ACTN|nr:ABC transporter substrate-binding protein [Streptomyces himalayensis subsp. himalayensis]
MYRRSAKEITPTTRRRPTAPRRQPVRAHGTIAAVLVTTALLTAGCGRDSSGGTDGEGRPATAPGAAPSADFGDLKNVCGPGDPTGAPAKGVTDKEIQVGVLSDVGFTKNPEFPNAAKVFTEWCNDAGGIHGRQLVPTVRDTKLVEVRQRVIEACRDDFALVGGSAALDGLGVKERLSCLMPDFAAQVVQRQNEGSDLQVSVQPGGPSYFRNAGMLHWAVTEAYPGSAGDLGIIAGDSPVTKMSLDQRVETLKAFGGTITYTDLYPAQGVSNWTPYAQAIKNKGVKGLIFMGDFGSLAKLEQALTDMDYKLDWIDANNNAYGPAFLKLAGPEVLATQNNLADLMGTFPLEKAAANPATKQVIDLFAKYAPEAQVTMPAVKAFSAWLLFAKSAASCGDALTRKCLYEAARKETAWTGGGLQAPLDLSVQDAPVNCFNVEKATPDGWKPADFKPDRGAYRCGAKAYKLTGPYGRPATLKDVGKSMSDFK